MTYINKTSERRARLIRVLMQEIECCEATIAEFDKRKKDGSLGYRLSWSDAYITAAARQDVFKMVLALIEDITLGRAQVLLERLVLSASMCTESSTGLMTRTMGRLNLQALAEALQMFEYM